MTTATTKIASSVALVLLTSSALSADTGNCDRQCLRKTLDQYLNAVLQHSSAGAPLAPGARATVNAAPLPNGEGIWQTATGFGDIQRRYADPVNGSAAYFGEIKEGDSTAVVALRVKVLKRQISEAEWTIARQTDGSMFSLEGLMSNPPPADSPVPAAERTPRAQLIAAADSYFSALQSHDGSGVPHVAGCDRIENGRKVTNSIRNIPPVPGAGAGAVPGSVAGGAPAPAASPPMPSVATAVPASGSASAPGLAQELRSGDCVAGFEMFAHSIAETSHRRYPVVDEAAGVVLGSTLFHRPPESKMKRNLLTEFFYEKQGKIAAIYAAMFYLDPSSADTTGWE